MMAELLMKRTIATKIATMSNELRTLGRMPPAIRSERRTSLLLEPLPAVVAMYCVPAFHKKYAVEKTSTSTLCPIASGVVKKLCLHSELCKNRCVEYALGRI